MTGPKPSSRPLANGDAAEAGLPKGGGEGADAATVAVAANGVLVVGDGSAKDETGGALGTFESLSVRFGAALAARLIEVQRELEGIPLDGVRGVLEDRTRDAESLRDGLSTQLMELYRLHQARSCFGLLYELNRTHLLQQVSQRLRRYSSRSDPNDLLQEVFFNIYRYPKRFDSSRDDAFRVWTATIVRNTVLKHLRSLGRSGRAEVPFEDLSEHPETRADEPLGGVIERESEHECRRVYVVHLHLYLEFYKQLSSREQLALQLVEVDGVSYRDAAERLGIRLENLKMVVFRARRKIYKAMRRVYDGRVPEVRPAREVKPRTQALGIPAERGLDDIAEAPRTRSRASGSDER